MIELYIEGRKIDLVNELEVDFTYETIDPNKLSSVKNSYSKTIDIQGTPANNITFSHIYRMDKEILDYIEPGIGNNYDPHKMVRWTMMKNGAIVNRGYCTLDNIKIKDDKEITYQLTLYGSIGNFFYNLSYNEDGTEKTLKDIFFNWRPKLELNTYEDPLSIEDETADAPLMKCSADIVSRAYHTLKPSYTSVGTTDIDKDVVFVPCYAGTYDNFDSKHIIVSTFNERYSPTIPFVASDIKSQLNGAFPDSFTETVTEDGVTKTKTYSTIGRTLASTDLYRYGIVNSSRDLDPSEVGDFRVNEMPVAIRLSKLLTAISAPENNGGYTVNWDDDILSSPYWNYSWVLLGKIKQDEDSIKISSIQASHDDSLNEISFQYYDHDVLYYEGDPQVVNQGYAMTLSSTTVSKGKYLFNFNYVPTSMASWPSDLISTFFRRYDNSLFISGSFYNLKYGAGYWKGWEEWNTQVVVHTIRAGSTVKYVFADVYYYSNGYPLTYNQAGFGILHQNPYHIPNTNALGSLRTRLETELGRTLDGITVHNVILNLPEETSVTGVVAPDGSPITFLKSTGPSEKSSYQVEFEEDTNNVNIYEQHYYMWTHCDWTRDNANDDIYWSTSGIFGIDRPVAWDEWWAGFNLHNTGSFFSFSNDNKVSTSYIPDDYADPDGLWSNYFLQSFALDQTKPNGFIANYSSGFNIMTLTKEKLFAESSSPMKYLTDYCKMMNYKFVYDNVENKIDIMTVPHYYKDNGLSLEGKVDLSREVNTKPVVTQYKTINFGLSTPETYPVYLFNKISKEKFNTYRYRTGIEYNTTETSLLDDNIYKNTIDYQLSSPYFNSCPQMPSAFNTVSVNWTLFDTDSLGINNLVKKDLYTTGIKANNQLQVKDSMPKLGLFDKNNKIVDCFPTLVFLNGFYKNYDYTLSYTQTETQISSTSTEAGYIAGTRVTPASGWCTSFFPVQAGKTYTVTGKYGSGTGSFLYAFFSNGTYIRAYERATTDTVNTIKTVDVTIPEGQNITHIAVEYHTTAENATCLLKALNLYTISPKIMLSNDTIEQYYLNGGRCYMYDFKYTDEFVFWGCYSSDQKGSAASWTLPVFSRDLYNTYYDDIDQWSHSSKIIASWNINRQRNLSDMTNISFDTKFIKDTNYIYAQQTQNLIDVKTNEYSYSKIPSDEETESILDTNWQWYLIDIYNTNTREVTLYANLSDLVEPNEIMRNIYTWRGHKWVITKMENYRVSNITSDRFTKVTMHKIVDIEAFTN